MKKITLAFMLFVTTLSFAQVTIGAGNDGNGSNSPPLNAFWGFSYAQSIYLASEIGASGNITSIDLALNAGSDFSNADDNVDVWIGHTTKTAFDNTDDWVDVATLTQVLTDGTVTIANDVLTITFSSSFAYNGTDNLIIVVDGNEPSFTGSGDYVLSTDGPNADMTLRYRNDSTNPDPATPPTGLLDQNRGNITFNGITQSCPTPTGLTAASTSTTEASFSWTAGGSETDWTYEFGLVGFAQGAGIGGMVAVTATSENLTMLTPGETYEVRVQANCGGGSGDSAWVSTTWTQPSPPPPNDLPADAIPLTVEADLACVSGITGISNAGSTDSGVTAPSCGNYAGATTTGDLWYTVVAPAGGAITFDTNNVTGLTSVAGALYSGTVGSLAEVDCTEFGSGWPWAVSGLTAGDTYYVRVWDYGNDQTGTFDLCAGVPPAPPANDDCANATAINSLPFNSVGDATSATNNSGFISDCGSGMNDGVWYSFTTVDAGTVDIALSGNTGWDAEIAIYSGSCGTFTCVDNADVGGTGIGETLTGVAVDANTQYWINIAYWSGSTDSGEGPYTIDVSTSDTTTTLKVDDNTIEGFTLFPTIVKQELNFTSQNNVEQISIFNLLGATSIL